MRQMIHLYNNIKMIHRLANSIQNEDKNQINIPGGKANIDHEDKFKIKMQGKGENRLNGIELAVGLTL